ncbi:MAG: oligosaccharide flippase family protein [Anaerorhabdus sp.]|uniref:lipopolysaccharide biosynthesis protein n=1 Tax=Anaerorhabdus sp. TaxID=1872524 RepID=UPI002FC70A0F
MKNGILKKSMPYAILKIVGYIVSMLAIPILTNTFSMSEYGELASLEAITTVLISIFLLGLQQSYIRYYNYEVSNHSTSKYNSTYFTLTAFLMIFSTFASFFVISIFVKQAKLSFVLACFVSLTVFMQQLIATVRAKEKTVIHSLILGMNDILGYFLPLGIILLFKPSIQLYFEVKLALIFIITCLSIIYLRHEIKFDGFNYTYVKKMLVFGLPLVLVGLGTSIFSLGDRLVIGQIMSTNQVAIYSVASKITHSIQQVLIYPISMVLFPMYVRIWENNGREKVEESLSKWFISYYFISIPIICGSFVIQKELITLLSNNSYLGGAILIPILCSGFLIYGGYYFVSCGLFVTNQTFKLGLIIISSSIVNIVLDVIFGLMFGLIGVAVATAFSYILLMWITYKASAEILSITIQWNLIARFTIIGIAMILFLSFIPTQNNVLITIFLKVIIGGSFYFISNLKFLRDSLFLKLKEKQ